MLSFDQTAVDRALYDTIILPLDVGDEARIAVERLPVVDGDGVALPPADICALHITTPQGTDLYLNDLRQREIGPLNGRIKTAGDLSTDARAAVLRLDSDGRLVRYSSVGATFLRFNGNTVWQRGGD